MILPMLRRPMLRRLLPALALLLLHATAAQAALTITFTAQVAASNNIDTGNVFGEGYGASLTGQIISGVLTINPADLTEQCASGQACYGDFGAGAIALSFTLNGITSTTISTGTTGYFAGSGGAVLICDPANGGNNYLQVGVASPDGIVQQSLGALFTVATLFDARANGDPAAAINSLGAIGAGGGLAKGGITYLSPIEHLDATLLSIEIPEPATLPLLAIAVLLLPRSRRARAN